MKLIVLNGPPSSGKDILCHCLSQYVNTYSYKFISPAEEVIQTLFRISDADWFFLREQDKDTPSELLYGKSLRQVFISFSEEYMKPTFGKDVFAKLAKQRLSERIGDDGLIVISDCGFIEEIIPIAELSTYNLLVRLSREGTSFEAIGDSRGYIQLEDWKYECCDVNAPFIASPLRRDQYYREIAEGLMNRICMA